MLFFERFQSRCAEQDKLWNLKLAQEYNPHRSAQNSTIEYFLAHQATTNKEVRSQIFIPRFDSEWRWLEISKYLSWHWHIRQANFAKGHRITIKFVQCTCMYIYVHTYKNLHTYIPTTYLHEVIPVSSVWRGYIWMW